MGPATGQEPDESEPAPLDGSASVQFWTELKRKAPAVEDAEADGDGRAERTLVPLTPVAFAPQYARA